MMRRAPAAMAATGLALATPAAPAAAAPAAAPEIARTAQIVCDVRLDLVDPDPAGLNIRATPGGAVIERLRLGDDPVTAHVVGFQGGWFLIESAHRHVYHPGAPFTTERVFAGHGWVHPSRTRATLLPGDSEQPARLYGALAPMLVMETPPRRSNEPQTEPQPPLAADPNGVVEARVTYCDGEWAQVEIPSQQREGYTRDLCSGPVNPEPDCATRFER